MAEPSRVSQYYRKKLEKHELTPEEWSAVRYAVVKHTFIGTLASPRCSRCVVPDVSDSPTF